MLRSWSRFASDICTFFRTRISASSPSSAATSFTFFSAMRSTAVTSCVCLSICASCADSESSSKLLLMDSLDSRIALSRATAAESRPEANHSARSRLYANWMSIAGLTVATLSP